MSSFALTPNQVDGLLMFLKPSLEDEHGRQIEEGSPVAGPGRFGSHDQSAEQGQAAIIIDAPACEVLPGEFPVRFERKSCLGKLIQHRVEFGTLHTDLDLGIMRVMRMRNVKVICDAVKGKKTRTDAQRGRDLVGNFHSRKCDRRRIQHRPCSRDPGIIGTRRPEEDQRRERGVTLFNVSEPAFPDLPVIGEFLQSLVAMKTQEHFRRRRRAGCPP